MIELDLLVKETHRLLRRLAAPDCLLVSLENALDLLTVRSPLNGARLHDTAVDSGIQRLISKAWRLKEFRVEEAIQISPSRATFRTPARRARSLAQFSRSRSHLPPDLGPFHRHDRGGARVHKARRRLKATMGQLQPLKLTPSEASLPIPSIRRPKRWRRFFRFAWPYLTFSRRLLLRALARSGWQTWRAGDAVRSTRVGRISWLRREMRGRTYGAGTDVQYSALWRTSSTCKVAEYGIRLLDNGGVAAAALVVPCPD